jgi:hypothetical protein
MDMFCTMLFVSVILIPAIRGYSMETTAAVEGVSVFAYSSVFIRESVGFINPLWLFAVYVAGKSPFPWWMMFVQLVSTALGWILGTSIDIGMTPGVTTAAGLGAPSLNPAYTVAQGLMSELYGTVLSLAIPLFYMLSLNRRIFYGGLVVDNDKSNNVFFPFVISFLHVGAFIYSFDVSKSSLNWFRFYFVGPLLGVVIPGIFFTFIVYIVKFGNPVVRRMIQDAQTKNANAEYNSL